MGCILPLLFTLFGMHQAAPIYFDTGYYKTLYEPEPQNIDYFKIRCQSELINAILMTIILSIFNFNGYDPVRNDLFLFKA